MNIFCVLNSKKDFESFEIVYRYKNFYKDKIFGINKIKIITLKEFIETNISNEDIIIAYRIFNYKVYQIYLKCLSFKVKIGFDLGVLITEEKLISKESPFRDFLNKKFDFILTCSNESNYKYIKNNFDIPCFNLQYHLSLYNCYFDIARNTKKTNFRNTKLVKICIPNINNNDKNFLNELSSISYYLNYLFINWKEFELNIYIKSKDLNKEDLKILKNLKPMIKIHNLFEDSLFNIFLNYEYAIILKNFKYPKNFYKSIYQTAFICNVKVIYINPSGNSSTIHNYSKIFKPEYYSKYKIEILSSFKTFFISNQESYFQENYRDFLSFIKKKSIKRNLGEYNKAIDIILYSSKSIESSSNISSNNITISLFLKNKHSEFDIRFSTENKRLVFIFSENFIDSLKKNNLLLYSKIIKKIRHNKKYNNYIFYYKFLNTFTDKISLSEIKIFESSIRLNSALYDMKYIPKISQAFNKILFLFFPKHNLFFL